MTLFEILYTLLIGPLELFFEVVFSLAYRLLDDPALAIVFLSLAMNFLVLPLYRRADALQEEQRDRAIAMKPWTDHIKKAFKGDERFMMLQAYNRQMGYKQTDILKSSLSLLLEIPFFIAAFHFLSNLELLNGVQLGPIADLGAPDALLHIGGMSINVLPIIMTLINVVSAAIYLKGFPLSSKIQTYGIAAIFLILLYNSPAGLVFYWTLNNVFSLVKNIIYKFSTAKSPQTLKSLGNKFPLQISIPDATPKDSRTFRVGCLFLALLLGVLIPLTLIQTSPAEFVDTTYYRSPLWLVAEAFALAFGTFVIWFGVFYWIASPKGKIIFSFIIFALAGTAIVNYLCFGTNYGNISSYLQYDKSPEITVLQAGINAAVVLGVIAILFVIWHRKPSITKALYVPLCLAVIAFAIYSSVNIQSALEPVRNKALEAAVKSETTNAENNLPTINLSKNGQNVVIIMLDRAIPGFVPYVMNEKPELKEMYSGFTVYTNATSYGTHTNVGSPALFGGSDYRPINMNERSDTSISKKHNEALKIMPNLFAEKGFTNTIFDPPYAGYKWSPDLSIYDDIPNTTAYIAQDGRFWENSQKTEEGRKRTWSEQARNFFCYSIFRTSPLALQHTIYQGGGYNSTKPLVQIYLSRSVGVGYNPYFMKPYSVLTSMPDITTITNDSTGSLFLMANDTTHEPTILQEPEYKPAQFANNVEYDQEHDVRHSDNGDSYKFTSDADAQIMSRTTHYAVNMASYLALGEWFEYLKANDVYDNTRIILVSDHSWPYIFGFDMSFSIADKKGDNAFYRDPRAFTCLLMVKDFNSTGFSYNDQFMTTADVPVLAMKGIIENPINPHTGNAIDSSYKQEPKQYLLDSDDWQIEKNNGSEFLPGRWFTVRDDTSKKQNWEYLGYY